MPLIIFDYAFHIASALAQISLTLMMRNLKCDIHHSHS